MKYVLLSVPVLKLPFLDAVKGLKATNPQFDSMWFCLVVYLV